MMDAARRDDGPARADGSGWHRFGADCAPAQVFEELIPEGEGRQAASEWLDDCACLALDRAPIAPGAHGELAQLERRTRAGLVARLARRTVRSSPGLGAAAVAALVPYGAAPHGTAPHGTAQHGTAPHEIAQRDGSTGGAWVESAVGPAASPDDALRLDLVQELARGYVVRAVERARVAAAQSAEPGLASIPGGVQASSAVAGGSSAHTAWALAQIAESLHPSPAARIAAIEAELAVGAVSVRPSPAGGAEAIEPAGAASIAARLKRLAGTARARSDSGWVAVVERLCAADAYLRGDLVAARAALDSGSLALDRSLATASLRCVIDVELEPAGGGALPSAERALDAGDRRRAARLLAAFRAARGAQTPNRPARRRQRRQRVRHGATR